MRDVSAAEKRLRTGCVSAAAAKTESPQGGRNDLSQLDRTDRIHRMGAAAARAHGSHPFAARIARQGAGQRLHAGQCGPVAFHATAGEGARQLRRGPADLRWPAARRDRYGQGGRHRSAGLRSAGSARVPVARASRFDESGDGDGPLHGVRRADGDRGLLGLAAIGIGLMPSHSGALSLASARPSRARATGRAGTPRVR